MKRPPPPRGSVRWSSSTAAGVTGRYSIVSALPETIDHEGTIPANKPGLHDALAKARFIRTQVKDEDGRTVYIQRW